MTLHSWEFGDPETVAIRREEEFLAAERACGKCLHKKVIEWKSVNVPFCELKRQTYGHKCINYKVKKHE